MNNKVHNQIVSFIWSIADDVLRDVFVRGKYRDIILPFTVLRRLDVLLVGTKEKVIEASLFMDNQNIDDKSALQNITGYPFWNTSKFTLDNLLNDAYNINSNLGAYLDGYSPNIQEIISKFKLRNQLQTMREAEITFALIDKFTSKEINLSTKEAKNSKGNILPPLTNHGMGYVFEELIRKFNEENNEEAGEHFTPREIIRLMTHLLFTPVKDSIKKGAYLIYDPACGSGGMLTEAEQYALELTERKANFLLYGQEVNPETYAICTSDMLIKGENANNIKYGSTLSKDGFSHLHFDFMLSNPPYGKTWKLDEDSIVIDRGKKDNEIIKDPRFQIGLPTISDGQLLFLMNMISKIKFDTKLGSRIASVHNGSALFTGEAGSGESEIRKYIIESDLLECIIALPLNIFYNTGIPTYVWIISNKKTDNRKGKVQLINAINLYEKLRKNLGKKNCEMTKEHIKEITNLYLNFVETDISKIYPNEFFGYNRIIVERPLRLSSKFTSKAIQNIRYDKNLINEMQWIYSQFGDEVYKKVNKFKSEIENYLNKNEIKLKPNDKTRLLKQENWDMHLKLMQKAMLLANFISDKQHNDYNHLTNLVREIVKSKKLQIEPTEQKYILERISWKNENAERVIKKIDGNGAIIYETDSDLRDIEKVPLDQDINHFFIREVLQHVPDAWIDENRTLKGYEISFTRYFHNYEEPRSLKTIIKDIIKIERETEGILHKIIKE